MRSRSCLLLTLLTKRAKKTQSMLALLLEVLQKKVREKKAASELCILSFKNDYIKFLSAIVIKLLERCPLKYSLVQSLMSVVPQKLVSDSAEAQVRFERLLQILLNGKWCLTEACDEILTRFKGFVLQMKQTILMSF